MNNPILVACILFESNFHWNSNIEERVKLHNKVIIKRSGFIFTSNNKNKENNDENEEEEDLEGYCSGEECSYSSHILKIFIDKELFSSKSISIDFDDILLNEDLSKNQEITNFIVKLLPKPRVKKGGSGYCNISSKSSEFLMHNHEYRYTLIKLEKLTEYPPLPCYC